MNTEQRIAELERVVREQQIFIQNLKSANTIPLEIDESMRSRFKFANLGKSSTVFNAFTVDFTTIADGALQAAGAPDVLLFTYLPDGTRYRIPAYLGSQSTPD